MPRTIQCPECGVVLNVPEAAVGRRLKCPKCATKFSAGPGPEGSPGPSSPLGDGTSDFARPKVDARTASSTGDFGRPAPSSGDFGRPSSTYLPTTAHGDFDLPTAPGSLREQFDLPLLGEDTPSSRSHGAGTAADPIALLKDDPPSVRRRPTGGDARANARRCPTCGSVVPRGMSLCATCGLDLDTNTRVDITEDIKAAPGIPRRGPLPIGVWIVGGLTISASAIFAIISLIKVSRGETGFWFLMAVCGFGIYAAVQFLRRKSSKQLLVALTLGVGINVIAMIIMPVVEAITTVEVKSVDRDPNSSTDDDDVAIPNPLDHLDTQRLFWGIAIIVAYGGVSFYLNSPPIRRIFH